MVSNLTASKHNFPMPISCFPVFRCNDDVQSNVDQGWRLLENCLTRCWCIDVSFIDNWIFDDDFTSTYILCSVTLSCRPLVNFLVEKRVMCCFYWIASIWSQPANNFGPYLQLRALPVRFRLHQSDRPLSLTQSTSNLLPRAPWGFHCGSTTYWLLFFFRLNWPFSIMEIVNWSSNLMVLLSLYELQKTSEVLC
jgi:hypothetical protein